jgi:hypothetical protein
MQHTTDAFEAYAKESHFFVNQPAQGNPVISERYVDRAPVKVTRVKVDLYTCKNRSTGKWQLEGVYLDDVQHDLKVEEHKRTVTARPASRSTGYGAFVQKVNARSLTVSARKCAAKPHKVTWLGVARGVTALPVPIPQRYAVAQAVAALWLPDAPDKEYYCGTVSPAERLPIRIARNGKARLGIGSGKVWIGDRRTSHPEDRCNYQAFLSCRRHNVTEVWVRDR